jgi:CBS domain-containing protein
MQATLMPTAVDIMTAEVITVTPDISVERVARLMFERAISGLPVVDDEGMLVGIVSEFDVITKRGAVVGDIMSRNVVSVGEDTDPETIAELVGQNIRRLPVLRDGRVVGIISRSDLIKLYALTRWSCESCGYYTRGFERLSTCPKCGNSTIVLEREPPGM